MENTIVTRTKPSQAKIATIGGGSGQFTLLSGLRHLENIVITAIVSMVDSGGSTGRLRDELGILPPGDILKCVLALSPHHAAARSLLQKRFQKDRRLRGHNAGNMLLTMLSRYTGSFPSGISALSEILDVEGTILPVTIDRATLVAELTDGTRIFGERAIDIPEGHRREKIKDVYLVPHHAEKIRVYPPVVEAIECADAIILGPGDLFTSIIPNLVVPGVGEALRKTSAKIIYIVNIMTKFGETHTFQSTDFVRHLEAFTHRPIDIVVANTGTPNSRLSALYAAQNSDYVMTDPVDAFWRDRRLLTADLIDTGDQIIRHHPQRLAELIQSIINE